MNQHPDVVVCYLLRRGDKGDEVLVGRKLTGLGAGRSVAPGGKILPGESREAAVVREVAEETGIVIDPAGLEPRGTLDYRFPSKPEWSQRSFVFVCRSFSGNGEPSTELEPEWWALGDVPLDRMWDDAASWLPAVLAGGTVDAVFEFGADLSSVVASDHPGWPNGRTQN
ncbi:8-oxo-dGTP diphosphatase [Labedella phragmitis]|uniref:Oxidized purine nucleoside triphosphate hydrolase n=1 Tax=Labedella phragmitis TaxID=2498849 RepID=A0A444PQ22_9MICO|nr:8-oxo-dGTP diphosphatase [Labedella phragmitis]RWZ46531.1 8-oxo-dGTP diphosphatase [Labedella phragmitis]